MTAADDYVSIQIQGRQASLRLVLSARPTMPSEKNAWWNNIILPVWSRAIIVLALALALEELAFTLGAFGA